MNAGQMIRRFMRFTKTTYVMDHRPDDMTRRARCERYAKKNKTERKGPAFYTLGDGSIVHAH